ncbi:MAG: hypothetical protein S4CHLAM37_11090 [Chlamydiia bacterium]|nr:hypothetical protein [Chlamydiia bacterium]
MKYLLSVLLVVLSLCFTNKAYVLETCDKWKIENAINEYVHAWNHNKGVGFANDFSEDAVFINIFGMIFSGRNAIEERHVKILDSFLKDSTFEVKELSMKEIAPGVVVALVNWKVEGFKKPGPDSQKKAISGVFSHTLVQKKDTWKIEFTQNTLMSDR